MLFVVYIFLVLALTIDIIVSHTCTSFNQIPVLLQNKNGREFNQTINGCIERIEFPNNVKVTTASVREQRVPSLWRDTVRNMLHLTTVSFVKSEVETLHPIAFRNVPRLSTIEILEGKLVEIPKDVFTFELTPQLKTLLLNENKINFIEDKAFYNLSNLNKIEVRNNKLEAWRQEWFENATSLNIMNFQQNRITSIPRRAFQSFPNLQEIYFDYNNIAEIHRDAFKEIRSLNYLGLGHNKLKVLEASSFPNTLRINTLVIGANFLNYLSNDVLKKLTAVKLIRDFNPWKCPCLDRIDYWLYIKNGQSDLPQLCNSSDIPICAVPRGNPKTCEDTVDDELTEKYINSMKEIVDPFIPVCARIIKNLT